MATPVARALAKDSGLDINNVKGTGPAGRVTKDDILRELSDSSKSKISSKNSPVNDKAVLTEPLVEIVLTDKWLPAVPFLQIACFTFALWPIHTANLQAINAMGRSDIFLKLEIIKKIMGLIVLGVSLPFGVYAIALGGLFSGLIGTFINAYPNKELLNYSYKEQWLDIMPSLLISLIMGGIVYLFNFLSFPVWQVLILQTVSGGIIYILLAKIFKIESFTYLVETMKQLIKSRKGVSN